MTQYVEAAINEIIRVAAWSLRALEMKFAVAERAAPIVAWTEAVEGDGLETLRIKTSRSRGGSSAKSRHNLNGSHWEFDATGKSLLEIGPIAIDLLTLAARTGSVGRVDIANLVDPVFLSGVIRIGAKRKIGIVALPSTGCLSLCGRSVSTIHAYPGVDQAVFDEGTTLPKAGEVESALLDWRKAAARDTSTISLFSYLPRHHAPATAPLSPENDAEGKFRFALSHGIQVDKSALANLYELEVMTWAPTSERSRGQALF